MFGDEDLLLAAELGNSYMTRGLKYHDGCCGLKR